MKVRELRALLAAFPDDAEVVIEKEWPDYLAIRRVREIELVGDPGDDDFVVWSDEGLGPLYGHVAPEEEHLYRDRPDLVGVLLER